MRHKRQKAYKKLLGFYALHFHFRSPLQILLTPAFIQSAHHAGYDLGSLLQKTVQDEVRILVSQCSMQEIYDSKDQGLIAEAKRWERRRCGHVPPDTKSTEECTLELLGSKNKFRYLLGSNDDQLRAKARAIPGVPILHFNRGVLVFENVSGSTKDAVEQTEREKLHPGDQQELQADRPRPPVLKRKRNPHPNPLAVRKKKSRPDYVAQMAENKKKERERRLLQKVIRNGE